MSRAMITADERLSRTEKLSPCKYTPYGPNSGISQVSLIMNRPVSREKLMEVYRIHGFSGILRVIRAAKPMIDDKWMVIAIPIAIKNFQTLFRYSKWNPQSTIEMAKNWRIPLNEFK